MHEMNEERSVIIVVDVLNGFCRFGTLSSPRLDSVVPGIHDHLARELAMGSRAIFLADTHAPDDPEFEMFAPHCIKGSGEEEIVDELGEFAANSVVLRKRRYPGFFGTDLDRVLAQMSPSMVEVVGLCTDICVLHTVADLRNRDYLVTVSSDLVQTYDGPRHPGDEVNRWALEHMRDVLGAVVA
jgi:nicotinamidase/pyrazinamidase